MDKIISFLKNIWSKINPFNWFKKGFDTVVEKKYKNQFSVFNKNIIIDSDEYNVYEEIITRIPDGTYTSFTFKDNKLVGYGQAPQAKWTPRDNID